MNMHTSFDIPSKSEMPAASCPTPVEHAFLRSFERHYQSLDGLDGDDRTDADRQYDDFAYCGAREMMRHAMVNSVGEAAIVALIAREATDQIMEGFFGEVPSSRLLNELRAIRDTLDNLWRSADERGGRSARRYAEHVGAADESDRVRWLRGQND